MSKAFDLASVRLCVKQKVRCLIWLMQMNGSDQSTRLSQIVWQRERGEGIPCLQLQYDSVYKCWLTDCLPLSFSHTHTLCLSHTLSFCPSPTLHYNPTSSRLTSLPHSLAPSLPKVADKRSSSCRGHWIWLGLTHSGGETVLPTVPASNQCKDTPSSNRK